MTVDLSVGYCDFYAEDRDHHWGWIQELDGGGWACVDCAKSWWADAFPLNT